MIRANTFDEQHFQALIQFLSYRSAFAENELTTHSDIHLPILHWLDRSKSEKSLPSLSETTEAINDLKDSEKSLTSLSETTEAINDLKDDDTQYLDIKKLLRKVGERQVKHGVHPNHWLRAFSELRIAQAIKQEFQSSGNKPDIEPRSSNASGATNSKQEKKTYREVDTLFTSFEQNKKTRHDDLETELATSRP